MTRCFASWAASVLVLASGCHSPGFDGIVAMNGCPPGRTCADGTGLSFSGALLGDGTLFSNGFPATAVGGSQRVTLYRPMGFELLAEPFVARSTDEGVARVTVVEDAVEPGVLLEGIGAGLATLEISNMRGELFDAIDVQVRSPVSARVVPSAILGEPHTRMDYLYFRGGTAHATIALFDATGTRVADESGEWISPVATDSYTSRISWDTREIVIPDADAFDVVFQTGTGERFTASATTVGSLDRIARVGSAASALRPLRLPAGGETSLCYVALAGERLVVGASFGFEGSGSITVAPHSQLGDAACVAVTATTSGTGELRVTAAGVELVDTIGVP